MSTYPFGWWWGNSIHNNKHAKYQLSLNSKFNTCFLSTGQAFFKQLSLMAKIALSFRWRDTQGEGPLLFFATVVWISIVGVRFPVDL